MRFRLSTIFWVVALLAAGMAAFGVWGIGAWAIVVWYWGWGRSINAPVLQAIIVVVVVGVLLGLPIPAVQTGREVARKNSCINNLRYLFVGIRNYEEVHGRIPAPVATYGYGEKPRSWRVAVLPYLEAKSPFNSYRGDKAWDGPNNSKLARQDLYYFCCPSDEAPLPAAGRTNYFAVVDPRTACPPNLRIGTSAIKDGGIRRSCSSKRREKTSRGRNRAI